MSRTPRSTLFTKEQRRGFALTRLLLIVAVIAASTSKTHAQQASNGSGDGVSAESLMRFQREIPHLIAPPAADSVGDYEIFCRTEIELIRSPIVLGRVLSVKELAPLVRTYSYEEFRSRVDVERVGGSEFVAVRFRGPTPDASVKICNQIVEAYFKIESQEDAVRMQRIIELNESVVAAYRAKLLELSQEVERQRSKENASAREVAELELASHREIYQKLYTRMQELRVEVRAPARVTLLTAAVVRN